MGSSYVLRINSEKELFKKVNEILGVYPTSMSSFWEITIHEDSEPFAHAISYFMNIIESKIPQLNQVGVYSDDITVWYLYEYEGQCNMEFLPNDLSRLGKNGITLCISCWEK
jgi:hypothetical protein